MPDVTLVTSRELPIDDSSYTISLYRNDAGRFYGFWSCGQCATRNLPTVPVADRDKAIQECEDLVRKHHAGSHALS
jgi:hypothetical protein